ncbi:cystathionine gamma-synthase [Corynebacterium lactis]|nr:cystathionine gamma-synthase [Corynebacterium lactis]
MTKKDLTKNSRRFSTAAVRAGYTPDSLHGSINMPIYASSTFVQDGINQLRGGFEYTRCGNPTIAGLERAIADLEGASYCRAFSSGMAATDAILRILLKPGSHIVMPNDVYGGTHRLIDSVFGAWGIDHTVVDIGDAEAVAAAIQPNTTVIWVETPTNPLLTIADIEAIAAAKGEAKLVVDNTFASPYLQRPLELGADVVLHSTTKYLGGHSDVVGGALVTNAPDLDEEIDFMRGGTGAIPSVFDAYLTTRGIKTLAVRMERHCDNAAAVAKFLASRPEIAEVYYPGLGSHRNHGVAKRQMCGFGGMVSARLADATSANLPHGLSGQEAAEQLCLKTVEFELAESLGGVESLIEVPAGMTHQSVTGTTLEIPRDLVRLSVGIEDIDDLIADLAQALDNLGT